MRISTPLLGLPLLIVYPERAVLNAQVQTAHASAKAAAEGTPTSVRWNRLVPTLADESAAPRRAARSAPAAAGRPRHAAQNCAAPAAGTLSSIHPPQRRAVRCGEFRARRPCGLLRCGRSLCIG